MALRQGKEGKKDKAAERPPPVFFSGMPKKTRPGSHVEVNHVEVNVEVKGECPQAHR
jgi:hypothetical protein